MFIYASIVVQLTTTSAASFYHSIWKSALLYIWLLLLLHMNSITMITIVLLCIFFSFVIQRYEMLRIQEGVEEDEHDKIKWARFGCQVSAVLVTIIGTIATLATDKSSRSLHAFFIKQCPPK
jgi:tetrahydromethanopterin S-methyltransferase subunit D